MSIRSFEGAEAYDPNSWPDPWFGLPPGDTKRTDVYLWDATIQAHVCPVTFLGNGGWEQRVPYDAPWNED